MTDMTPIPNRNHAAESLRAAADWLERGNDSRAIGYLQDGAFDAGFDLTPRKPLMSELAGSMGGAG